MTIVAGTNEPGSAVEALLEDKRVTSRRTPYQALEQADENAATALRMLRQFGARFDEATANDDGFDDEELARLARGRKLAQARDLLKLALEGVQFTRRALERAMAEATGPELEAARKAPELDVLGYDSHVRDIRDGAHEALGWIARQEEWLPTDGDESSATHYERVRKALAKVLGAVDALPPAPEYEDAAAE